MKNLLVLTASKVSKELVRKLVRASGGVWEDDPTLDQGCLAQGHAAIYISYSVEVESEYDPEEIRILGQYLGAEPVGLLDIHIGHADGSEELARKFTKLFVDRWGGFIDDGLEPLADTS